MTLFSRFFSSRFKLPVPQTRKIQLTQDIKIPMSDGVILLADHYSPKNVKNPPLILTRTPYGRKGFFGLLYGRLLAEQGYQVLIQSCRGTFGSGSELVPYVYEKSDGLATIEWMKKQNWYPGQFATIGGSYMGFTQWTIVNDSGPDLKAITPHICASDFYSMSYPGRSFSFQTGLEWVTMMATQGRFTQLKNLLYPNNRRMIKAFFHLPLKDAVKITTGKDVPYWDHRLGESANNELQTSMDLSHVVKNISIPVNMVSGWYDIFLPWQLIDYKTLCDAGNQPYLTIGPWSHTDFRLMGESIREGLVWFNSLLKNDKSELRKAPIRLFIMGANKWQEFQEYPPKNIQPKYWYLQSKGKLSTETPKNEEPDHYVYDPADPTPSVGGTILMNGPGPKTNNKLEARNDVLIYTSEIIKKNITVIGPVKAELYVQSSLEFTDFFSRLCDVSPKGKSVNICDGIIRLTPQNIVRGPDGIIKVEIDLWPTAYQFKPGHRIRVQVSSGAHPRFVRNLGTGESFFTGVKMNKANQTIYHDSSHPSSIILLMMPI